MTEVFRAKVAQDVRDSLQAALGDLRKSRFFPILQIPNFSIPGLSKMPPIPSFSKMCSIAACSMPSTVGSI